MNPFTDPEAVARYAEGPRRLVPGFADMLRMATLLTAERAPEKARVLVVGAGGGLEMRAFAEAHAGWRFEGVDPSAEMLRLARATLGAHAARAQLHQGTVTVAPDGPFDAATCLLTMHFIAPEERLPTLRAIHRRLAPGAPFVMAHHSFSEEPAARDVWFSRFIAFAASSGVESVKSHDSGKMMEAKLTILAPEREEALLREAGFAQVETFYAGMTFRGWIAHA